MQHCPRLCQARWKGKPRADTTYGQPLAAASQRATSPPDRLGLALVSPGQGLQQGKQAALPRGGSWGPQGLITLQTLAETPSPATGSSRLLAQGCRTKHRRQLSPGLEAGSPRSRCWKILSLMRILCIFLWWGGREGGVLCPLFFLLGYKSYPGALTSWSPGNPKYLSKPVVLTAPL